MDITNKIKPYGARLLRIIWLNLVIALVLGLALWSVRTKASHSSFSGEIIISFIHSIIYGFMFGLAMPYLGERLAILRVPLNWVLIIVSLLIIAFVSTLVVDGSLLGLGYLSIEGFHQEYFFKSISVFLIALMIASGIYIYEKMRDRIQTTNLQLRTQELEKERAIKLITEARLASLESRLHPHFLFNTLNSISALISEDPQLADKMVQRLAHVLRTSLDACEQSSVPLCEEVKLVVDYLEIEKARFRERLTYSIVIEPGLGSVQVPPLTLQPIVENSVKFAVSHRPAGGEIRISARLQTSEVVIEIWDNGPGFTSEMIPVGHGLDNLQARLGALFGDCARLSIDSQEGGTIVIISMPANGFYEKNE